ncbi:Zn-dependent hydrolase, glyoxylase [Spongiibacter sp. IMCC21906]|uniref:MBL fold metallo-hydrolase n=1 Tax=Spongiibacter sp. IMCC21906 TaxID=1620392 RepID=UPI00062DE922|nr:MBL fold metallo-hydrolase [Spongiibacter sp. IMCC21906]AKH69621.1 Zn-dependent hydrolase, glyoxylase [Spongiibacter sp. IMCC21906]
MNDISYPHDTPPQKGEWLKVAEGVYWLQMTLPMSLDHINLYVLEDDAGWWIVDTGMKTGDTQERWQLLFDGPMAAKPVIGVICTHMHPDHVGKAGWLCDYWRAPLYMSFGEYLAARAFASIKGGALSWSTEQFYVRTGVNPEHLAAAGKKFRGFGNIVEPIPMSFQRLSEGTCLKIGGREWRVMLGSGHSPEHACLYAAEDKLLLSGDQIIPRITSNVSVMPTEPDANPLAEWFVALNKFNNEIDPDTLVLPAHNAPFYGVRPRLEYLIAHHEGHLAEIEKACKTEKCALDLLGVLFKRRLEVSQMTLAIGEAVAHLNFLVQEGRLQRRLDEQGIYRYRSLFPDAPCYFSRVESDSPLMEV